MKNQQKTKNTSLSSGGNQISKSERDTGATESSGGGGGETRPSGVAAEKQTHNSCGNEIGSGVQLETAGVKMRGESGANRCRVDDRRLDENATTTMTSAAATAAAVTTPMEIDDGNLDRYEIMANGGVGGGNSAAEMALAQVFDYFSSIFVYLSVYTSFSIPFL